MEQVWSNHIMLYSGHINEIVDQHKADYDENHIDDFIDEFLRNMKKETDPSFTVILLP